MIKKIGRVILALLLLAVMILTAWYQIDGQPLNETRQYFDGNGYSVTMFDDGSLVFAPDSANGFGLLIMHGALIKPQSYAKTAAYFAEAGI